MWGRVPRFGGNDSPFGPPAAAEMVAALPLAQYVAPITTTEGQLAVLFDLETARCAWGVVWWGTFVVGGGNSTVPRLLHPHSSSPPCAFLELFFSVCCRMTELDGLCSLRLRTPCDYEDVTYDAVVAVEPVRVLSSERPPPPLLDDPRKLSPVDPRHCTAAIEVQPTDKPTPHPLPPLFVLPQSWMLTRPPPPSSRRPAATPPPPRPMPPPLATVLTLVRGSGRRPQCRALLCFNRAAGDSACSLCPPRPPALALQLPPPAPRSTPGR